MVLFTKYIFLPGARRFCSFLTLVNYLQVMSNLLYMCGMCGLVKEMLLMRYFSKVLLGIHFNLQEDSVWTIDDITRFLCFDRMFVGVLTYQNQTSFDHVEELVFLSSFFGRP